MTSVTVEVPDEVDLGGTEFGVAEFISKVMSVERPDALDLELFKSLTAASELSSEQADIFAEELGDVIKKKRLKERSGV